MKNIEQINLLYEALKNDFPFKGYIETSSEIGKETARVILSLLPLNSKILDFGSGPCDKTALISRLGYDCYACDDLCDEWHLENNNRELILSFAEKEKINFALIKDGSLPYYPQEYFDAVLILDVIEHWRNSPRKLLNTLINYLKPSGYLFVGMPNSVNIRKRISVVMGKTNYCSLESFYFCGEPWRGHVREYTQMETERLIKYQGLNIVYSFCINTMINKHHILKNNYLKLIYKFLTNIFPRWRDSILVVGQKPKYWKPVLYNPEIAAKYIKRPVISRSI